MYSRGRDMVLHIRVESMATYCFHVYVVHDKVMYSSVEALARYCTHVQYVTK
jgi:hypothetical protein